MGFRVSVSLPPAIQATGRLTFAPAGLIPAEHTSLRWTHRRSQLLQLALNDFVQANRGQSSQRLQKHGSHYGRRQAALPLQCSPPRPDRRNGDRDAGGCGRLQMLWRLRRATTMETGLFKFQADHLSGFKQSRQGKPVSREIVYALFGRADPVSFDPTSHAITNETEAVPSSGSSSVEPAADPTADLARCFLRLANLPNFALDRLSRYEAIIWRQAGQILFALDALDRRKPQERGARFRLSSG